MPRQARKSLPFIQCSSLTIGLWFVFPLWINEVMNGYIPPRLQLGKCMWCQKCRVDIPTCKDKHRPVWMGGLLKLLLLNPTYITCHGPHALKLNETPNSLTTIKSDNWTLVRLPSTGKWHHDWIHSPRTTARQVYVVLKVVGLVSSDANPRP